MIDKKHHWLARLPGQLSSTFANAAVLALIAAVAATAASDARAQAVPLSVAVQKNTPAPVPAETASAGTAATVRADDETVQLGRYVVSASRTAQDPRYTPSSVTLLDASDLAVGQITDLHTALAQQPGVIIVNNGPAGSRSSILMRGAQSHQTLLVVDGVRMNDKAADYGNYLGVADLSGIDRIEILRGPQSTLYGSSAMGGVVAFNTPRGSGAPHGSLSAEAGAFHTWQASASIAGGTRFIGYSASVNRLETENDAMNNEYKHWGYTTRLEYAPAENILLGGTFRGDNGEYQEIVGGSNIDIDNYLGTLYAQARIGSAFTSRITGALHERHYVSAKNAARSEWYNKRKIADWQNTWQAMPELEVVAGLNYEETGYYKNDSGRLHYDDDAFAAYVSMTYRPLEQLAFTGGVRYDDFDSAGDATTGRIGATWLPTKTTKIKATYGTGFGAPALDDTYGTPATMFYAQIPNPDIKPEKSKGWDVGIEQDFLGKRLTAGVTYFENRFTDLLVWKDTVIPVPPTYYMEGYMDNIEKASTSGVEIAVVARPIETLQIRINYTYLNANNDTQGTRLARRPRHTTDGEIRWQAMRDLTVGLGAHGVADRIDSYVYGTQIPVTIEDYTRVRVFASYTLRPANLTFKVRLENALNEKHEEIKGYPALPFGAYAGIEWRF